MQISKTTLATWLYICVGIPGSFFSVIASPHDSRQPNNPERIPRNIVRRDGNSCLNDVTERLNTRRRNSQVLTRSECALSCDDVSSTSSLYPFVWSYCPSTNLHFVSEAKETRVTFQPPIVGLIEMRKKKIGHQKSGSRRDDRRLPPEDAEVHPVIVVDAVPKSSFSSGSLFPLGATRVQYQGVVSRNDCLDEMSSAEAKSSLITEKFKQFRANNLTVGSAPLLCEFDVVVHDAEPPEFIFCPGDREIHLRRGQSDIVVNYDKPIVRDNSKKKPKLQQVRCSFNKIKYNSNRLVEQKAEIVWDPGDISLNSVPQMMNEMSHSVDFNFE